ncbi:MAG: hypothetical protein R3E68_13090 [Burkholderiaceae bacterium]
MADYGAPLQEPGLPLNCFEVRAVAGTGEDTCLVPGHPRTEPASAAGGPRRVNVFRTPSQRAPGSPFDNTLVITQTYRAPGADTSNEANRPMRFHLGLLLDHAAVSETASAVDTGPDRARSGECCQASIDQTPRAGKRRGQGLHLRHCMPRSAAPGRWSPCISPTVARSRSGYEIANEGVGQKVPGLSPISRCAPARPTR